jgi:DNA polymerase-1
VGDELVEKHTHPRISRLRERYRAYQAKLTLPLHDAYIFECPLENLKKVAEITADVMKGVVQEYYPQMTPQVEVNINQPHCWNKDGKSDSLQLWLRDARAAKDYLRS